MEGEIPMANRIRFANISLDSSNVATFISRSITAFVAIFAFAATAQSQDDSGVFEEIIVTATKRATTLQATPVAVSVVNADVMEKAQIHDIKDLQSIGISPSII